MEPMRRSRYGDCLGDPTSYRKPGHHRQRVRAMGTKPARTACRCPWQNPVAERWIGSCWRELLEHVVVLGERHLVRLIRSYLEYYHGDRTHVRLAKDALDRRPVTQRPPPMAKVVALPRVGGLDHRYEWRETAWGYVCSGTRTSNDDLHPLGPTTCFARGASAVTRGQFPGSRAVSSAGRPCD